MAFRFPIRAYTRAQLEALANPAAANQPEAIPHVFFDTMAYTSTVTTVLTYFQVVQVDKTLGNIESAGQLPDPQYFQIFNVGFDILNDLTTTSGGILGAADTVQKLMIMGRPICTLTIAGKKYIDQVPLSFMHQSGGVTGFMAGTWTAEENITWGLNSIPDGGYCVNGAIIIPPKQAFDFTLRWAAAQVVTPTPINLRLWMAGVWFRRVL